jgi:hypothetical protein
MLQPGVGSKKMEPNLHQKQGINHLNRVLAYAKFVTENGRATVHLTPEDWHVVADTLFHMETPAEMLPEAIESFRMTGSGQTIELRTPGVTIELVVI